MANATNATMQKTLSQLNSEKLSSNSFEDPVCWMMVPFKVNESYIFKSTRS